MSICKLFVIDNKNIVIGYTNGTISVIKLTNIGVEQFYLNNYEQQVKKKEIECKMNKNTDKVEVVYEELKKCKVKYIMYCYLS